MTSPPHWVTAISDFRHALRHGLVYEIRSLFRQFALHLFFHLQHAEIIEALNLIGDETVERDNAVTAMRILLSPDPQSLFSAPNVSAEARASLEVRVAYMVALRLRGQHREAHEFMVHRISHGKRPIHPIADSRDGWPQFAAVQIGVTAMLMGDMRGALSALEEARWRRSTPGLEIITREATSRSALIHATFGCPAAADSLVRECRGLQRSDSWGEPNIDVACAIVDAMLCRDAATALSKLGTIGLSQLGEIWPFYVQAEYRALDSLGAFAHAGSRLAGLEALPFACQRGEGYSGSVLPLMMALNDVAIGNPTSVREHLQATDPHFALSGIVRALFTLQIGSAPTAITLATGLRRATAGLRRLELWRLSILGDAHLAVGDRSAAIRALQETSLLLEPLSRDELTFFSKNLRLLGEQHITEWPEGTPAAAAYMDQLPRRKHHLTDREVEVLRHLSRHTSRKELAETLFVSPNTLKTQLRSIFRKLGASSRQEALHEASLRGLL